MIPMERQPGGPQEFPFLGATVMLLALHAIFAVTLPASLLRSIVALAAFFAMGYSALALIVDGHVRLSAAEVLAFTVGLTILLTSLSALAVSIVGIKITEFAIVIIGLPIGVLAWLLRRPRERPWTAFGRFARAYFDFSDYSAGEKAIAAILLVAIVVALGGFISLAAVFYPDRPTMGIAITWPDPSNPSNPFDPAFNGTFLLGQSRTINVAVLADNAGGNFTLCVRLVPANATLPGGGTCSSTTTGSPLRLRSFANHSEDFTVGPRDTREWSFSVIMEERGTFDLRFELINRSTSACVEKSPGVCISSKLQALVV